MKKIYLLLTAIFIGVAAYSQNILVLHGGTALTNNDNQMYDYLLENTEFSFDTVGIASTSTVTLSDYDAVLLTETPGSSDVDNNFTAYDQIPVVNLKTYGLRKTNITWIEDNVSFFTGAAVSVEDSVPDQTEIEILADHDVFIEVGGVGDVFSFADAWWPEKTGGHYQAFDLGNSGNSDIATSSTDLGKSTHAEMMGWDVTTILAAIEANSTSMRSVVFGMHSEFNLTDDALKVVRNSLYWVQGLDNPNVSVNSVKTSNFAVYPNPVSDVLNVNNSSTIQTVELIDITGKIVSKVANDGFNTMQLNTSDLTSGMYIVRLNTIDGSVYTDKIVK